MAMGINAQLMVQSNGIVKTERLLINEMDSVFWNGDYGLFSNLYGNTQTNATAICGRVDANMTPVSGAQNVIGLRGEATGGLYTYGVKGSATGGAAYGVYGLLPQPSGFGVFNNGAAIYGTLYNTPVILDDSFAGYFDGKVKIVGGLWVTGGSIHGTLYGRAATNDSSDTERFYGNEEEPIFSEKLSKLHMGTFHESLADSDTLRKCTGKSIDSEERTDTRLHYGLSAEQLEETFPDLVTEDKDGNKYINYVEMVPILVQAINELSAEVTTLRQELGSQESGKKAKRQTTSMNETDMEVVSMSQNRPNPFKDKSVITLTVPSDARQAAINIYDMSGKQVQTIPVSERGKTNITVYARQLQPGMFIYSLLVDGKVQATRKMMVTE